MGSVPNVGLEIAINYIAAGPEDGQRILLVHGFGASSYHWRYQVSTLAEQGYRVYSVCLLGYGWSDRAVLQYSGEVWSAQINDFLNQVAGGSAVAGDIVAEAEEQAAGEM
eukprot:Skav215991  [mRNA]  locus=scaffold4693:58793:63189:+ [translate_table: standard]